MKPVVNFFYDNAAFAFFLTLICSSAGVVFGLLSYTSGNELPPFIDGKFFLLVVPVILTAIIFVIDWQCKVLSRFITDGENEIHDFITDRLGCQFMYERDEMFFAIAATFCVPIVPLWLALAIPSIMPYVLILGAIISLYFGIAFSARFVYRLSRRLTSHVNDPNAHKE